MIAFRRDEPLARHSTFGIGGPARLFAEVRSANEMVEAIRFCRAEKERYLIIGKGSNTLFDDRGFKGAVILNKIDFIEDQGEGRFSAGGGASFALLGVRTARARWGGLEFASGIPGSVGGAVVMNAGANGQETCDALTGVEWVTPDGELTSAERPSLEFSYRTSPFQGSGHAVVAAHFALTSQEGARRRQIEIVEYRRGSQPYGEASAGCVFRNPGCESAGSLIERAGLKGMQVGGAVVSPLHANFIVNASNATARDVLELLELVKAKVRACAGIELEEEVRLIPYE